jgi:hypothetical protein
VIWTLAETLLRRAAEAARSGPPCLRITVPPRWARFLVAAGARPAPADDSMDVHFSELPPLDLETSPDHRASKWPRSLPQATGGHYAVLARLPDIRVPGFSEDTYQNDQGLVRAVLQARSVVLYLLRRLTELRRLEDGEDEEGDDYQRTEDEEYLLIAHQARWAHDALKVLSATKILGPDYEKTAPLLRRISAIRRNAYISSSYLRQAQQILEDFLEKAPRPTKVSGVYLGDLVLLPEDLDGIIWNTRTTWADPDIASYARRSSEQIGPGTFQIRDWQLVRLG